MFLALLSCVNAKNQPFRMLALQENRESGKAADAVPGLRGGALRSIRSFCSAWNGRSRFDCDGCSQVRVAGNVALSRRASGCDARNAWRRLDADAAKQTVSECIFE